jgi:energy-coupling factor transporter ATP-binding protein EcfA2
VVPLAPGAASGGPCAVEKPASDASLPRWLPKAPVVVDEIDVSGHLLTDIALRHVSLRGTCTIHLLSDLMKLSVELSEGLFRKLIDQQLLEVRRMVGDDYVFALSPAGRRMVAERSAMGNYSGPVPVSLAAYTASVRAQTANLSVNRATLSRAFSDIVVGDAMLDALGPALISQRSVFLYGPSGTGKTTLAERLTRIYEDGIVVPYAIEVDGQIVTLGDPAVHEQLSPDLLKDCGHDLDPRWMFCRRPYISAGGELVMSMLDLQRDEASGTFMAPLQMKANNGMLLIDDLGRQAISPRDLLNRWIVPLDRRVDFLSLGSGRKFDVPFEVMVLFSTNLAPAELADDAFLRRIPNKILVGGVDAGTFDAIFQLAAAAAGVACEDGLSAYCREVCLRHGSDLRPCYPRDLFHAIRAIAVYEERKPFATREAIDRAAAGYFL